MAEKHASGCRQCGATVVQTGRRGRPRTFCSTTCRNRLFNTRANAISSAKARASWSRHCAHCSKPIVPAQNKKLCSNACKLAAWTARRPDYVSPRTKAEIARIRRMPGLVVRAERALLKIRQRLDDIRRRALHSCADCGAPISGVNLRLTYCSSCCEQRAKKVKRISRAVGKAKRRLAVVERFDPIEVLERDRWRCHLCGVSTPRRLRGTHNDRAPELDHIVPIAAGGEHSRRNTACACRKCNIAKSDKPLGQLRLVA